MDWIRYYLKYSDDVDNNLAGSCMWAYTLARRCCNLFFEYLH
jgi:hypothetical protein